MTNETEKRQEARHGITSAVLPFLGNRASDYQPFQYLIQDISATGVKIALPRWVVFRDILAPGESIHLQVPFQFEGQMHASGVVAWQKWDTAMEAQICGIALDAPTPLVYPVHISLESQAINVELDDFAAIERLLVQILGDSALVKQGLGIYLRHLDAYFYRTAVITREEYTTFSDLVLKGIMAQVQTNYDALMGLYTRVRGAQNQEEVFSHILDLDDLSRLMTPEVAIELFSRVLSVEEVDLYLKAIKALEQKLYINYNTLIMLYLQNLIQNFHPHAPAKMPCPDRCA
ncbi:MAG: PilZ domain-containing protein [Thermodesulfobacteriota bacterium]